MKFISEDIQDYSISKSNIPSTICEEIEVDTKENVELPQMLVGKMEASFLGFLIRSHQVKNIVEFGTFTGYSALAMAENLPSDGQITTFDISVESTNVAKKYWNKSEHGKKINLVLGNAIESIKNIEFEIDLAFIDADKENYTNYLNESLERLSPNGIIVVDNVLWSGSVLKKSEDSSTVAIQEMNDYVATNDSLYGTLLPIRDGMFLIQKR
jgi:caffeoyl-CoA O-methyltransferase